MSRATILAPVGLATNPAATTTSGTTAIAAPGKKTRFAPDADVFVAVGGSNVTVTAANGIKLFASTPEYIDTTDGFFALITATGSTTVNVCAMLEK